MVVGVEIAEREGDAEREVHAWEPVSYRIVFSWNVSNFENIALEEDTPANDNGDLTSFNPDEVTVISFKEEWFTA